MWWRLGTSPGRRRLRRRYRQRHLRSREARMVTFPTRRLHFRSWGEVFPLNNVRPQQAVMSNHVVEQDNTTSPKCISLQSPNINASSTDGSFSFVESDASNSWVRPRAGSKAFPSGDSGPMPTARHRVNSARSYPGPYEDDDGQEGRTGTQSTALDQQREGLIASPR